MLKTCVPVATLPTRPASGAVATLGRSMRQQLTRQNGVDVDDYPCAFRGMAVGLALCLPAWWALGLIAYSVV